MGDRKGLIWRQIKSSPAVRFGIYIAVFCFFILFYTTLFFDLYPILENKPITLVQALLFVIESVSTTGYGEILPFHNELTNIFAITMVITGVILIFMIIPLLLAPYLKSLIESNAPKRTPHKLFQHLIIVGFSEFTLSLIESMMISDHEIVIVVESEQTAVALARRYWKRAYVIWGDFNDIQTWRNAWIETAGTIVVSLEERIAAKLILGIKNETAGKVIAVVDKIAYERYLRYAGCEYVLSPKNLTGKIIARHAVLTSHIENSLPSSAIDDIPVRYEMDAGSSLRLIHIPIMPGCRAAGKTLGELSLFQKYGYHPLFLTRLGDFNFFPKESEELDPSTLLFLIGKAESLKDLVDNEFVCTQTEKFLAVIAGFGDVGQAAYQELSHLGISCVVIDRKPHPVTEIIGNAEDEAVLKQAHIEEAMFLVVALNDDTLNIFTTLIARDLNPSLRILARANEPSSVDKLYRAGADYVALLPKIGGQVVGGVILADTARVILDLPLGKKVVMKRMMYRSGVNVGWLEKKAGIKVIGIEGGLRSTVMPNPEEQLFEGSLILGIGDAPSIKKFIRLI